MNIFFVIVPLDKEHYPQKIRRPLQGYLPGNLRSVRTWLGYTVHAITSNFVTENISLYSNKLESTTNIVSLTIW